MSNKGLYFSKRVLNFLYQLEVPQGLPPDIQTLNPYPDEEVRRVTALFYNKFYHDRKNRKLILGINPGRFGAGVTGIPFTDPVRLQDQCQINNHFDKRGELSSEFVYRLIEKMGGAEHFYTHFYIGAVSPLGFTKNGKNYNYYDSIDLKRTLKPYIIESLIGQISFGLDTHTCFCMGQGKNFEYLTMLNTEMRLFKKIVALPHPRWVMQYRRKELEFWLNETIQLLIKS